MALNKPLRYATYYSIVIPIVLAFLPCLLVWMTLDITKRMIEEIALSLKKKLKLNVI